MPTGGDHFAKVITAKPPLALDPRMSMGLPQARRLDSVGLSDAGRPVELDPADQRVAHRRHRRIADPARGMWHWLHLDACAPTRKGNHTVNGGYPYTVAYAARVVGDRLAEHVIGTAR